MLPSDQQPPLNPYAAPQAELHPAELPVAMSAPLQNTAGNTGTILTTWVVVFFLNLPFAVYVGLDICKGFGALGMIPAIVGYLVLTIAWIRQAGRFAGCWIAGAICVAASQFLPYLHLVLGLIAVSMFGGPREELHFFGALCCSLIVGGGLIAVSLALAGIFYLVFVSWNQ